MLVNEAFPQRRGRGASLSVSEIAQHLAGDAVANFARAAVFAEFGRHARALDQADFVDRMPRALDALLIEIGAERGITTLVERKIEKYAALDGDALELTGGDRFPSRPIHVVRP